MGQKWLQTLHLVKAKSPEGTEKKPKQRKGKKWKFWKSSVHASDGKQEVAAPKRPGNYGTEEWAAIVIQTAFRVFLARRALRAIRGLVRLQALVRGRKVRKQATITLRCMQTLVKVQAGVRARQAKMLNDMSAAHLKPDQQAAAVNNVDVKASEKVWSDSVWTKEELISRIQDKQKAAVKRERALAYAFSHQWRAHTKPAPNPADELEWGWLERWMASRPWENRAVEEALKNGMLQHAAIQETCNSTPPKKTSHKDEPATPTKKDNGETAKKTSHKDEPATPTKKDNAETASKPSTPAKKDSVSPAKLLVKINSSDSPSKPATPKKVNASRNLASESVDSPKSVQSVTNNTKFHSPGSVKSSPVAHGVVKPVVKSRYMDPKKVHRADSTPKQRPASEEIEQQKRRLSLPSPRARDALKPKSPIKV